MKGLVSRMTPTQGGVIGGGACIKVHRVVSGSEIECKYF